MHSGLMSLPPSHGVEDHIRIPREVGFPAQYILVPVVKVVSGALKSTLHTHIGTARVAADSSYT